jgi:hypothetical protein
MSDEENVPAYPVNRAEKANKMSQTVTHDPVFTGFPKRECYRADKNVKRHG